MVCNNRAKSGAAARKVVEGVAEDLRGTRIGAAGVFGAFFGGVRILYTRLGNLTRIAAHEAAWVVGSRGGKDLPVAEHSSGE